MSRSLWNKTAAPGWSEDEIERLKKCLLHFGIGRWSQIDGSGCFPGKTKAQINLQTQRLLGQQSLREFFGLHINVDKVWEANSKLPGDRKNGMLINVGDNPDPKVTKQNLEENRQKYGIAPEIYEAINIDSLARDAQGHISNPHSEVLGLLSREQKMEELVYLKARLQHLQSLLSKKSANGDSRPRSRNSSKSKHKRSPAPRKRPKKSPSVSMERQSIENNSTRRYPRRASRKVVNYSQESYDYDSEEEY